MTTVSYHGIAFTLDLKAIREALTRRELADGRTLAQVADAAGVSRMSLWRLLAGQRVALMTLHRVLTALELDPKAILRTA